MNSNHDAPGVMTALDRLHQAEAAALEAEDARQDAYKAAYKSGDKAEIAAANARCANTQANLLAALDAARGDAVVTVNRHMLAQLGPDRWIPATRPEYPLASTDVALFAAPPAAAVCAPDSSMAPDSGHTCASLEQAPPAALAVPAEPAPNPESADFKAGVALGRAESEFLAAAIKNPACGLCGATCSKDAETKCVPNGDSCPGVEWPLANLWALAQQPAAAVPEVLVRDAARYRWLRDESWAGYNVSKRHPKIAETIAFVDGMAGGVKTILAEDALDAAIDRAMLAAANKENTNG